jgi:hypothetical protein
MGKVQDRAHAAAERLAIQQASIVQGFLMEMKRMLRNSIPKTFQWWVTVDNDGVKVEYIWLGHPDAMPRECSDGDFSILWLLLADKDWKIEVEATLADISEREGRKFQDMQERRNGRMMEAASSGVLPVAHAPLMIEQGAGGESPPDRPATDAQAVETGRRTRQDIPTAMRSRRRSKRDLGQ